MRHELIHAFLYISIHAPTRGATKWIPCCGQSAHISIHAPARGATNSASMMSALSLFQSTLPQGERRQQHGGIHVWCNFNPRSHKGSDRDQLKLAFRNEISIHAPTRGATPYVNTTSGTGDNFNPRSHKGSDAGILGSEEVTGDFNPRSHKGSDSNFTQNSISVLFHFYQSFPHIIFPHTARFRLLIIFCTFFLVRIAQRFPVCFHFAPKQYPAFYNVCSTDLL